MKKCCECLVLKGVESYGRRKSAKDGLQYVCKPCLSVRVRTYYVKNKDKVLRKNNKWNKDNNAAKKVWQSDYEIKNKDNISTKRKDHRRSEGIGVFKVTHLTGIYIGSGQLRSRRLDHMGGRGKLKVPAISFEVLVIVGTTAEAREIEEKLIASYGLDNLLNSRRI